MPKEAEDFIQRVARKAGKYVLSRFGKDREHKVKEHMWDVVTKADLASERIILSAIKKKYSDHGIISEESGNLNEEAEYLWTVDPIDGTLNFATGVPLFGVMIALVRKGEVILSVVYLPSSDELFFARAGKGAYLNDKRIHCSDATDLNKTFGMGSTSLRSRTAVFLKRVLAASDRGRMMYSSFGCMGVNACYVASGRRDWIVPLVGSIWDYAPAYLLLKESGCMVTDTSGKPWKFGVLEMVAANPVIHRQLLKLTKNI